ncbi:MAG: hypothetical protein WC812_04075 [Candidatus Pacearchaeota archaeon]|jgi:hypothetical protein
MKKENLWNEKIPFIKEMKEFYLKMNYKGINLWPIMANDIYTYYSNKNIEKKERKMIFLKCLFFKDEMNLTHKEKNKILVSYFMPREDHHSLVYKAIEDFPKEDLIILDNYELKKKKGLKKGRIIFPNIFLFLKILNKFKRNKLKKLLGKYYYIILARTYQRHQEIKRFHKLYKKILPKAYISFCSQAFAEETILTSICKINKIPTFTLQHGFIVEYPYFHGAMILNENVISDYNLIWGKTTYNVLKKYTNNSRLIVVGNPKYSSIVKNDSKIFNPKKCVVFFPVPGGETNTNKNMAKIINDFAKKYPKIIFEASVHPFDNLENYKKIMDAKNVNFADSNIPIMKRIEESDFIILHNSTIAIEALRYEKPIFRFNDKFLINLWKNEDKFKDKKELERRFEKIKNPKTYQKFKKFYAKEFEKNFKITPNKKTPKVYYEEVIKRIK